MTAVIGRVDTAQLRAKGPTWISRSEITTACDEIDRLRAVEEAARELSNFLENEKQTQMPPDDLLDAGIAALETAADYDREDQLSEKLAAVLAALEWAVAEP